MAIGVFLVIIILLFQVFNLILCGIMWISFYLTSLMFTFLFVFIRLLISSNYDVGDEIVANWKKKYLLPYHIWFSGELTLILASVIVTNSSSCFIRN